MNVGWVDGGRVAAMAWWIVAAVVTAAARPRTVRVRAWSLAGRDAAAVRGPSRWSFDRRSVLAVTAGLAIGSAMLVGPVLALSAVLVLATLVAAVGRRRSRRIATRDERDALAAVRFLRGELAAGSTETAALHAASAVAGALAGTLRAAAVAAGRGGDVARVLDGHDPPSAAVGALARAWRVRAECGASLAGVIGRVEDDLTDRAATRRAVAAALAGPRSSASVLAGLPVVGVAMGAGMGARPGAFLLDRGGGSLVLLVGVALDALGVWWTDRLARRAEP